MARADEVYANAFTGSYWWRLKAELVHQRVFHSVADAREQLLEYIDGAARAVLLQAPTATLRRQPGRRWARSAPCNLRKRITGILSKLSLSHSPAKKDHPNFSFSYHRLF